MTIVTVTYRPVQWIFTRLDIPPLKLHASGKPCSLQEPLVLLDERHTVCSCLDYTRLNAIPHPLESHQLQAPQAAPSLLKAQVLESLFPHLKAIQCTHLLSIAANPP